MSIKKWMCTLWDWCWPFENVVQYPGKWSILFYLDGKNEKNYASRGSMNLQLEQLRLEKERKEKEEKRKGKVNVCVWFGQKKSNIFHAEGCLLQFSNVTLWSRIGKMFSHVLMNFKGWIYLNAIFFQSCWPWFFDYCYFWLRFRTLKLLIYRLFCVYPRRLNVNI